MPTAHRQLIYEYLFKEGVLVAKKDFQAAKHPEIAVPNLHVIKTLQVSLALIFSRIMLEVKLFRRIYVQFVVT
jgi:hypothetical protein